MSLVFKSQNNNFFFFFLCSFKALLIIVFIVGLIVIGRLDLGVLVLLPKIVLSFSSLVIVWETYMQVSLISFNFIAKKMKQHSEQKDPRVITDDDKPDSAWLIKK